VNVVVETVWCTWFGVYLISKNSENSVQIHAIEGNQNLRALLAWHLQQSGYQVQQSPTLAHAYQCCAQELPTLAIVDSDLPDGEGIEFCQWLYPQGNSLILMLSARTREIDLVSALQAGVDDYLKKPFGMPEFLARVEALLRRNRTSNVLPTDMTCGDLRIDLVRRCIYLRNRWQSRSESESLVLAKRIEQKPRETRIDLSPQEFSLLYVLAQANGRPVHRRELLKRAWDIDVDNPRTVDSHVLSLRKKLGHPDPNSLPSVLSRSMPEGTSGSRAAAPAIETVRKIGYRLNY
jgi:two-component system, OmpR family, response regulator